MSAPFFCSVQDFNKLNMYDRDACTIVDQDDHFVMGYTEHNSDHDHIIGEELTGKKLTGYSSLWFTPSGKVYFVPSCGHDFTAAMLGYRSAEVCEEMGWIHLSFHRVVNYTLPKVTDRCYDAIAKYCEDNNRDMFSCIINQH